MPLNLKNKCRHLSLISCLLLVVVFFQITEASSYTAICSLQRRPTYLILKNRTNDEVNTSKKEATSGKWRSLAGNNLGDGAKDDHPYNNIKNIEPALPAWACSCAPTFYCLSSSANSCGISSTAGEPIKIKCIHTSNITMFARNIWFPLILVYICMFITLFVTPNGNQALYYMFRCCFRSRNERLSEQISMEIEAYKKGNLNRRKELVLKIRRFESSTSIVSLNDGSCITNDSSDSIDSIKSNSISSEQSLAIDEDPTCSICLSQIHHGDIIGALTCNHEFHVDCLKVWLKRSNVCPLCMSPDVATTRIRKMECIEINSQV